MTYQEKLKKAEELNARLSKVKGQLYVINGSRKRKDKLLREDSKPEKLKLMSWECTGDSGHTIGDNYDSGITDRELLVTLFNAIEPILLSEKRALEAELMNLMGTSS